MTEQKIFFKAIRKHRRQSLATFADNYRLSYPVGEWVLPYNSQSLIFVFDTRENAEAFLELLRFNYKNGTRSDVMIVKCEVSNDVKPLQFVAQGSASHVFDLFWRIRHTHMKEGTSLHNERMQKAPEGTYGASSIKCLE